MKLKAAIRKVSGFCMFLFFILVLGKAGAADCGTATWEEFFPSSLVYMALAVLSFHIWEATGGNKTAKIGSDNEYEEVEK